MTFFLFLLTFFALLYLIYMRTVRFIGDFNLDKDEIYIKDERIHHHSTDVLRLKQGDTFVLGDGVGDEADVRILDIDDNGLTVKVNEVRQNKNEPDKNLTLFCSIVKRGNFEEIARMITQIGVTRIVPIVSERTVKKGLKRDRLEKIIVEAAEQSDRGVLPFLEQKLDYKKALDVIEFKEGDIVFLDSGADSHISDLDLNNDDTFLFIGPEGGFSKDEIKYAKSKNVEFVNLGKTTLKTETAAVSSTFFLLNN